MVSNQALTRSTGTARALLSGLVVLGLALAGTGLVALALRRRGA